MSMAVRIALGIVAVLRAALIYGEGGELAARPLRPPARRLGQLVPSSSASRISHAVGIAMGGKRERRQHSGSSA
jgi:hypothetical protein